MSLQPLFRGSGPLPFDIQQTTLSQDVLGRFVCNTPSQLGRSRAIHEKGEHSVQTSLPLSVPPFNLYEAAITGQSRPRRSIEKAFDFGIPLGWGTA